MKPKQVEEPRRGRTTTKSVPMESEKPTGPATQHGDSSGSGVHRSDVVSSVVTRPDDEKLPEVPDVEMDAEDSYEAQVKRAKTVMGLDVCVLEAQDDVYDEAAETLTNLARMSGVNTTDEDVVAPDVTEELNRLKLLGRPYTAPTVNELMPQGPVYSQRPTERLDDKNGGRRSRTRANDGCVRKMRYL